jgi:type I restriction enzyme R subunit
MNKVIKEIKGLQGLHGEQGLQGEQGLSGDKGDKGNTGEKEEQVRKNATVDWKHRESARAKRRIIVRCVLRQYGYPPDKERRATETVLQQAELLSDEWAPV